MIANVRGLLDNLNHWKLVIHGGHNRDGYNRGRGGDGGPDHDCGGHGLHHDYHVPGRAGSGLDFGRFGYCLDLGDSGLDFDLGGADHGLDLGASYTVDLGGPSHILGLGLDRGDDAYVLGGSGAGPGGVVQILDLADYGLGNNRDPDGQDRTRPVPGLPPLRVRVQGFVRAVSSSHTILKYAYL